MAGSVSRGLLCLVLAIPAGWAFSCVGVPDGVYEESCKTFVTCIQGQDTFVECQDHLVSNGGTVHNITCVDPDTVDPPCGIRRDCSSLADGRYADVATNCTSYFTCHNHFYYGHNHCSPGLVFVEAMGLCTWPDPAVPCRTKAPQTALIG